MNTVYLEFKKNYEEDVDIFYAPVDKIEYFNKQGVIPNIRLKDEDIAEILNENFENKENNDILVRKSYFKDAPTVGVVLQKRKDEYFYSISFPYVKTLLDAGVNIKFMDSYNVDKQILTVDGLFLPGGLVSYPEDYKEDEILRVGEYLINKLKKDELSHPLNGYVKAVKEAKKTDLPILAICSGAQILSNLYGIRMEKVSNITDKDHRDLSGKNVHSVYRRNIKFDIFPTNKDVNLDEENKIEVNSIHRKTVKKSDIDESGFTVHVVSDDGLVEAWGSEKAKILCIQWHPEIMYTKFGKEEQLVFYKWLKNKAEKYKKSKENYTPTNYIYNNKSR